jgi:hypothetical protein
MHNVVKIEVVGSDLRWHHLAAVRAENIGVGRRACLT